MVATGEGERDVATLREAAVLCEGVAPTEPLARGVSERAGEAEERGVGEARSEGVGAPEALTAVLGEGVWRLVAV